MDLHVAILGGGPAGASLATYLARQGVSATVFDGGERPPLIVGESLVPAVIPFLKRLGIEDEVKEYGLYKPGAIFRFAEDRLLDFRFGEVRGAETLYAYNVPRDRLDASIRGAAERAGARLVPEHAKLERDGDRVRLSAKSLAAGGFRAQPDWIIDASGRARVLARLLDLPTEEGDRRDAALHAHFEGVTLIDENVIHTDRLDHGWSWRIPLPGRVSVGLVMDKHVLREFGDTAEEQFEAVLRHDPLLNDWGATAKRITPVMRYTNYQLQTQQVFGPGWALVGDAFGFVDPVFSSGLLIGLDGAYTLSRALLSKRKDALARYEAHVRKQLTNWHRVVRYFYDGRLFTLFQIGDDLSDRWFSKPMNFHFRKHMPRVITGEATTHPYSMGLLDFMVNNALLDRDPAEFAVR
ncbi:MAG: NAD(P)/FAD-dependent oxidoreductase [Myxococcota bacterium]